MGKFCGMFNQLHGKVDEMDTKYRQRLDNSEAQIKSTMENMGEREAALEKEQTKQKRWAADEDMDEPYAGQPVSGLVEPEPNDEHEQSHDESQGVHFTLKIDKVDGKTFHELYDVCYDLRKKISKHDCTAEPFMMAMGNHIPKHQRNKVIAPVQPFSKKTCNSLRLMVNVMKKKCSDIQTRFLDVSLYEYMIDIECFSGLQR